LSLLLFHLTYSFSCPGKVINYNQPTKKERDIQEIKEIRSFYVVLANVVFDISRVLPRLVLTTNRTIRFLNFHRLTDLQLLFLFILHPMCVHKTTKARFCFDGSQHWFAADLIRKAYSCVFSISSFFILLQANSGVYANTYVYSVCVYVFGLFMWSAFCS